MLNGSWKTPTFNYTDFLIKYAKKKGLKITNIDEHTFKINSRDGFLRATFRDHKTYLEAWGSCIELSDEISLEELEKLLESNFKKRKMLFLMDENFNFYKAFEINSNKIILKDYLEKDAKYYLECCFFKPSKLYKYTNKVQEIPMVKRDNPIEKLKKIFNTKNISYRTDSVYLGELEYPDPIILTQNNLELKIYTNFTGSKLFLYRDRRLNKVLYKLFEIDLTKQKLEDIDFLSYF